MSLLKNAIFSIEAGIEDFQENEEKRNISAVRNIYAGILLLLKEKLVRLSPEYDTELLIKQRLIPQKAEDGKIIFKGVGNKTVNLKEIKDRFKSLNVNLDWVRLEEISRLRNDLEHYYTDKPLGLVREILAKSFLIIRDFLTRELNENPVSLIDRYLWAALLEVEEVFSSEKKSCDDSFQNFNWKYKTINRAIKYIKCCFCDSSLIQLVKHDPFRDTPEGRSHFQEYFTKMRCNSCGEPIDYWDDLFEQCLEELFYAELYMTATQGGVPPVDSCPGCGKTTFVYEEGCCVVCDYQSEYEDVSLLPR